MGPASNVSLGWSDATVPLHTHACFYYTDEASLRRTLAFIRVGLDEPETFNVIFADQIRHESLLAALQDGYEGDVALDMADGKLGLVGGAPTREELLAGISAVLTAGMERGHKLLRFLGFIAWGHEGWPAEDDLLLFESQVNSAVRQFPAVIICTYGVPALNGRQLIEGGLGTHPIVFLNDRVLSGNPLYVAPELRPGVRTA